MRKKLIFITLCMAFFLFTGCSGTKQIDKVAIAETVTIEDGEYTFYLLSKEDVPKGITIEADSLKEACKLAKDKYIPELSISKIELLLVNEKIYKDVLKNDIEYISKQAKFSPLLNVAICDKNTIKLLSEKKGTSDLIKEQIIHLKKKDESVCVNSLSIFNSFSNKQNKEFCVSYINSQKELSINCIKIFPEK